MKQKIVKMTFFIVLMALTLVANTTPPMTLNGVALVTSVKLKEPLYIGGIFLEKPSNRAYFIMKDQNNQRIELRIIAEKWSSYNFIRTLRAQVALNSEMAFSSNPEIQRQINQLLDSLIKSALQHINLRKNDIIAFEFSPGKGTTFQFNNTELYNAPGKDLFNLLLASWIGKHPPSREIRYGLLGIEVDNNIRDQFLSILPDVPRRKMIRLLSSSTVSQEGT
ncbi:MAG: chalcone isomerase family protein [Pseudomonadales bacterium]